LDDYFHGQIYDAGNDRQAQGILMLAKQADATRKR